MEHLFNKNRKSFRSLSYDKRFIDYFNNCEENKIIGRVHSIFDKVINIVNEDNIIFSIAQKEIENAPYTLRITNEVEFSLRNLQLDENSIAIKIKNKINIDNKITINIIKGKQWTPKQISIVSIPINKINDNLKLFKEIIISEGNSGGAKYFYTCNFTKGFKYEPNFTEEELNIRINKFIKEINEDSFEKNIYSIIGLGPGLTPSGDDFLTGFIMTLGIINIFPVSNLFNKIKKSIVFSKISTTDISRQIILSAINREGSETVNDFIYYLMYGNKTQFKKSLNKILSIGSSSGTDLSIGVVTAFIYIINLMPDYNK